MKFKYTNWNRIPTIAVEYTATNGTLREGYLTPYRRYGFQVTTDLEGADARGLIFADLEGICDAAGGYQRQTLAALAFAGLAEWASSMGVEDQIPSVRFFTRKVLAPTSDPVEERSWTEIQTWLTSCEMWLEHSAFTPGGYDPTDRKKEVRVLADLYKGEIPEE